MDMLKGSSNAKRRVKARRLTSENVLRRPRISARKSRQIDQKTAGTEFPVLKAKLERMRAEIGNGSKDGRYGYYESLKAIYALAWTWHQEGKLVSKLILVAKLNGLVRRKGANLLWVLVSALVNRDRKTISRWSKQLSDALEAEIPPGRLKLFLSSRSFANEIPDLNDSDESNDGWD